MKTKIITLCVVSTLLSTCTICPSENEFYSILLKGSWIRYNETIHNCSEILTFIDGENIQHKFQKDKDTSGYKYEMNFSELLLYNNSDEFLAKYNLEFIDSHDEIKITRIDSLNITTDSFASFEGRWKKYQ